MTYEISGTSTPSKVPYKWGLLKNNMKVTARLQPKVTAKPCSFSPIDGLTKIEVCDQITDPDTGRVWDYCRVGDKYGFILYTSIRDYLRTPNQSIDKVARWVIANDFSIDETRRKALESLGYDYEAVQKVVTDLMPKPAPAKSNKFCVWAVNFMEDDERQFGDCTAVIQYNEDGSVKHCVLIDCAKYAAAYVVVRKLKAHGVKKIDAVCISHAHGDHYGGLSYIMKHIPVNHIYVPDVTELKKYQSGYASAIKSQAKKAPSTYLRAGSGFSVGDIKCKCVFICPANKLSEHDDHHFVNNESMVLRFDLDGIIYHTAGDLQNPGNNILIKTVSNLKADIYKAQWHGDANACNEAICKAIRPRYAFSNYHHKPSMSGRGTTRKRLQAVGAKFYDNYTYGDIFFYISNGNVSVKTSKKG